MKFNCMYTVICDARAGLPSFPFKNDENKNKITNTKI